MHKLKKYFSHPQTVQPVLNIPVELSASDIYQYRKHRGTNLGSWFVLERWIADKPFQSAHPPGQSDLDVARGRNAREILETHWDTWIIEDDWKWIAERGLNAVRIPIGYYHLCGQDVTVLRNTPFQDFQSVYSGAWSRITRAIETASRYGLGVLVDLHAAPGKQNNDAHAGTSDHAQFFAQKESQKHTIHVLTVLLKALRNHAQSFTPPLHNLIGIELLNEPNPPNDHDLQAWYTSAIKSLRTINPTIPILLGECWRPDVYTDFISKLPLGSSPLILDHHLYRCFTSSDIHTSAPEHTRLLSDPNSLTCSTFARVAEKLGRAGGGLVVGEWSGALNPGSLTGAQEEQASFVKAQLSLYERHCAGWFFWTYKKQWGGDKGWSLQDAGKNGTFPDRVGMRRTREIIRNKQDEARSREEAKAKALAAHEQYWSRHRGNYQHWRFEDGFLKGWNLSYTFLDSSQRDDPSARVTELGLKGALARKSTDDYGSGYWEFEHGFIQGVDAAARHFASCFCI